MQNKHKNMLLLIGSAALLSFRMTVPTPAEKQSLEGWENRAVANVISCANIRSERSTEAPRVGTLPSGAMAEILEQQEGWTRITSGGIEGYIRSDLLAFGSEAQRIYEALHGRPEEATSQNPTVQALKIPPSEEEKNPPSGVSSDELELLAAIIQCEAGGECHEGKVAVGAVVMNRLRSSQFPDTIHDVIYQRGQFTPVSSGSLTAVLSRGARSDCYQAALDALNGVDPVGDCLYFNSGSGKGIQIGNQHFY